MFFKNAVMNSDDAHFLGTRIGNGESKAAIINLPAMLKDKGPLGQGFLGLLARMRTETGLLEYRKDFENLIDKIGHKDYAIKYAIDALNDGPMIITRATLDLIHQAEVDAVSHANMDYRETDKGPVVTFELFMGSTKLTSYINPLTTEGQGFLMAAWQFPMITWALVKPGEILSVQYYDARRFCDQFSQACNKALLAPRVLAPDFKNAVAKVKLQTITPTS